jgi:nitroimidazol reductase NimA-like FMN-containing flavoprotein (pyridoxamine 5'-phosphate oxidase superfamily)
MKTPAKIQHAMAVFRDLTRTECEALLSAGNVGRIAFSYRDSVDIRPIHYVMSDGWLFGRTSDGDKLIAIRHNQWVAFEVDEISGPLDWQSVVVRGTFYELKNEGSVHDKQLYERALKAIRRTSRSALTTRDPLAFRTVLFGVSIDSMTGKSCSSKTEA